MQRIIQYTALLVSIALSISIVGQNDTVILKSGKYKSNQDYISSFKKDILLISRYEKQKKLDSLCLICKETGDLCLEWKIYEKANYFYCKSYNVCNILPEKEQDVFQVLLNNVALTFYLTLKKDSSLFYYGKLLTFQRASGLKQNEIITLSRLVSIYLDDKNYDEALKNNILILDLNKELKDDRNIGISLNNIGFNYKFLNDYDNAIINFRQALEIFKSLKLENSDEYQVALLNLGILYQNAKDYQNANEYLTQLENVLIRNKRTSDLAELYNIKANICYLQNDKEQTIEYCNKSDTLEASKKNLSVSKANYLLLSKVYQSLKDNDQALQYYQMYKVFSDSMTLMADNEDKNILNRLIQTSNIENQLKLLAIEKEIAELDVQNIRLAAEKKEQFYQLELKYQQIGNQNKIQDLLLSQQKLEVDRQIKKILILNQQNSIQELALKRKTLEQNEKEKTIEILSKTKKLLEQDKELGKQKEFRQRLWMLLFALGFLVVSLFTIFYFRTRQKEHKTNMLLSDQYAEIEEKTEEISTQHDLLLEQTTNITASIEYARIIQQALFSSQEILDVCNLKNFIFFKPRDIISGDFYWFKQIKNYIYFLAADSTGHGVPGAFMSVLGITLLNEIVSKRDLNPPALVLNEFRKRIKKSLSQDRPDSTSHDGIDITLCLYDTETQLLQLSGAYNPLIIIRNNELLTYKTDRMPVGVHPNDFRDFTNTNIQLFQGDILYIFSDGFISQFGGTTGKKFNVKNFHQLLLDIHKVPIEMQKVRLEEALYKWQGNYEQIDDILIVGIEVNSLNQA